MMDWDGLAKAYAMILAIAFVAGYVLLGIVFPWLWSVLKPLLHAWTA